MRIIKNIFLILGILLIIVNFLAFAGGVDPFLKDDSEPMVNKVAYFIGSNFLIVFALIFFLVAFLINKRIKKKQRVKIVEQLFND